MPDLEPILRTAAFFLGSLTLVVLAKLLRDFMALRRGYRLSHLIGQEDNVAVAVEMAAFVLAMVIGLLGSIVVQGELWWQQGLDLVHVGLIVLAALFLNNWVMSKIVLRGVDCDAEVCQRGNLAVALARASGNIASALVIRAALGHDSDLLSRLAWLIIGQLVLVAMSWLYQRLTPYDDASEVQKGNVAAALPMAGILIAAGLVVEAAVRGESLGWTADLQQLAIDIGLSAVLLAGLRWVGDVFLLPGTTYSQEIARDRNAGAGMIEAASYIAGGFAVAYFLH